MRFMMALSMAAAFTPLMQATTIFDNGNPDPTTANEMTEWIQAENFQVPSATTVLSVQFWAAVASSASYNGSIMYAIYADNSGIPGALLASGSAAPALVSTGVTTGFGDAEEVLNFNLATGFSVVPGMTYWLGLHNGPLSDDARLEFYWEATFAGNPPVGQEQMLPGSVWESSGLEHAFELFDTPAPTPEPAALSMVGIGLALLGFTHFRKHRG